MFRPIAFLVLLLTLLTSPTITANSDPNSTQNSDDIKLVLIGIVVDTAEQVLAHVTVELEDVDTQEKQIFTTKEDGQFSFNLKAEKQYLVSIIDETGNVIATKNISTTSKKDPEILHTILSMKAEAIANKAP